MAEHVPPYVDTRTLVEKMLDVAQQDDSPHERDNARSMLAARGMWPPPPRPPAPPATGFPEDEQPEQRAAAGVAWAMPGAITTSGTIYYGSASLAREHMIRLRQTLGSAALNQTGRIHVSMHGGNVNIRINER